jgi:hypothetical protein
VGDETTIHMHPTGWERRCFNDISPDARRDGLDQQVEGGCAQEREFCWTVDSSVLRWRLGDDIAQRSADVVEARLDPVLSYERASGGEMILDTKQFEKLLEAEQEKYNSAMIMRPDGTPVPRCLIVLPIMEYVVIEDDDTLHVVYIDKPCILSDPVGVPKINEKHGRV